MSQGCSSYAPSRGPVPCAYCTHPSKRWVRASIRSNSRRTGDGGRGDCRNGHGPTSNGDAHPVPDTHADSNVNSHRDSYTSAISDAHADTGAHCHPNSDSRAYSDAHADTGAHCHTQRRLPSLLRRSRRHRRPLPPSLQRRLPRRSQPPPSPQRQPQRRPQPSRPRRSRRLCSRSTRL